MSEKNMSETLKNIYIYPHIYNPCMYVCMLHTVNIVAVFLRSYLIKETQKWFK